MPHVSWLRFDMHILEAFGVKSSSNWAIIFAPISEPKAIFFLLPSLQCVFFKFFLSTLLLLQLWNCSDYAPERHNSTGTWVDGGACNSELCRRTNREHRNSIILGRRSFQASTRETHTATTTKWLNLKPRLFSKNWSDVIKIVITNNSTSNCNLISHFVLCLFCNSIT